VRDDEFRENLEQIVPLVLTYGTDSLKIPPEATLEEISRYASPLEFIMKCHEGFKLAQRRIVNILLSIEDEMKTVSHRTKESRRDSQNSLKNQLKTEFAKLQYQRASFKEVANVIAWTLFGMERTHIKALMKVGMWDGYLRDRNITSVVNQADEINSDPNSFALITDITSCLGMGDLIIAQNGRIAIVEVKEGKVSEFIGKMLMEPSTVGDSDLSTLRKLSPAKVLDQTERFRRQTATTKNAIQYIRTDYSEKGLMTGLPRFAIDPLHPPVHLWKPVDEIASKIQVGQWRYLHADSLVIGILKPDPAYEPFVSRLDFQHYLYHERSVPWEKCRYTNRADNQFTRPEYMEYENTPIYSMRQKVFSPTRIPIFAMLGSRNGIDLLTDALRIYVYFDVDSFYKLCQDVGLRPAWMSEREYRRSLGRQLPHMFDPPLFSRGYLSFGTGDNRRVFMHGMLENLVYELETGFSVARKLKVEPPTRSRSRSRKGG
jgi:hypothetical protein